MIMTGRCIHIARISATDLSVAELAAGEISKKFECYSDIETCGGHYELEFSTYGAFPLKGMAEITDKLPGSELYIQVVTYDLESELVEHHVYKNGKWADRLEERYQNRLNPAEPAAT